jgi:hypothetical protein
MSHENPLVGSDILTIGTLAQANFKVESKRNDMNKQSNKDVQGSLHRS